MSLRGVIQDLWSGIKKLSGPQIVILVALCVIGGLVIGPHLLFGVVNHVTSSRSYCLSCHNNMLFSEMWEQSKLHRDSISCVYCHSELGEYLSVEPSAEEYFVSESCLRCHENITRGKKKYRTIIEARGIDTVYKWSVVEMHKWHVIDVRGKPDKPTFVKAYSEKKNAICVDCHRNIAHENTLAKTYMPVMEYCAECHPKAKYSMERPLPVFEYIKPKKPKS